MGVRNAFNVEAIVTPRRAEELLDAIEAACEGDVERYEVEEVEGHITSGEISYAYQYDEDDGYHNEYLGNLDYGLVISWKPEFEQELDEEFVEAIETLVAFRDVIREEGETAVSYATTLTS